MASEIIDGVASGSMMGQDICSQFGDVNDATRDPSFYDKILHETTVGCCS